MTLGAVSVRSKLDRVSLAASSAVREKIATPDAATSCREVSPVWNTDAIRRSFPAQWSAYLRANFASAYAVHKAFPGVDEKTCRDWWSGKRNPSGCFVAAVVARDARAMEILGRPA